MLFVIGDSASSDVDIGIISVFRGSPNVIIEYQLSSQSAFALDNAIRAISLQIAAGAVYVDGDLSYPVIGNEVISGEELISDEAAQTVSDGSGSAAGSVVGSVVVLVVVIGVILICAVVGVTVYCVRAKRARARELEAMAVIAALPGFLTVSSDNMPMEVGKKGFHGVVPSWDLGRITPGHSRVPSLENDDDDDDEIETRPPFGNHLNLPR